MNWTKVNLIEKTAKKKIVSHKSYILNQNISFLHIHRYVPFFSDIETFI